MQAILSDTYLKLKLNAENYTLPVQHSDSNYFATLLGLSRTRRMSRLKSQYDFFNLLSKEYK